MRRILVFALTLAVVMISVVGEATAEPILVLTSGNQLYSFDSATPGVTSGPVTITGVQPTEAVINIARRPSDGLIYGFTTPGGSPITLGTVYTIDPTTGVASIRSSLGATARGGRYGLDFDPVFDSQGLPSLRVTNNGSSGQPFPNRRIDIDTRQLASITRLAYAADDPNAGRDPFVFNPAYTNSVIGAISTTLYNIDTGLGVLVIQGPGDSGALNTVGSLGITSGFVSGFDISGVTGTAFAAVNFGDISSLYTVNLGTGAATLVGQIGSGLEIIGLTVQDGAAPVPEPASLTLLGTGIVGAALARRRRRKKSR